MLKTTCIQDSFATGLTFLRISAGSNPADEQLHLKLNQPLSDKAELTVCDANGQVVLSASVPAGTTTYTHPTETLPQGLYLLRIESGGVSEIRKLVVL